MSAGRVKVSPFRSPVVSRVLARGVEHGRLPWSLFWGALNLLTVCLLAYDLRYETCLIDLSMVYIGVAVRGLVIIVEFLMLVLSSLSFCYHASHALSAKYSSVTMTTGQSKLLKQTAGSGVLVSDIYKQGLPKQSPLPASTSTGLPIPSLAGVGNGYVSQGGFSSPQRYSFGAFDSSHQPMTVRARHTAGTMVTPTHRTSLAGDGSIADMGSLSDYLHQSPLSNKAANSSLESLNRSSLNGSSMFGSPVLGSTSPNNLSPASLPHPDMTTRDFSPVSARYQIARRSSSHPGSPTLSSQDSGQKSLAVSEMWLSLGVDRSSLDLWTEKCRRWFAYEILQPLVTEIDSLNKTLKDSGYSHLQFGLSESNALNKGGIGHLVQHLRNLSLVLQYLDVHANQEYLVWRIRELAKGSCLSAFRWDSGGRPERGDWDQSLPTDAAIVFHLFSTYLDSCLPPSSRIPDRRTFTLQFVKPLAAVKAAERNSCSGGVKTASPPRRTTAQVAGRSGRQSITNVGASSKSESDPSSPGQGNLAHLSPDLCFAHANDRPPHYQLLVGGKTIDVGDGRNNLFHSILYFLRYVKIAKHGMLGSVNLNLAGVGVLEIVDDI